MFSWLKSFKERWAMRREERRGTAAEKALRQNEAKAQRLSHERMDHKDPMAPGL
jgi:hypothetical protein